MSKGRQIFFIVLILIVAVCLLFLLVSSETTYDANALQENDLTTSVIKSKVVMHLATPEPLRGVYMTACFAGTPKLRTNVVKLIEETELNSVIIDIKDYTGTVSFNTNNPNIDSLGGSGCKVSDMQEFLEELHEKDIYVIGRVTVFQDPLYTKAHPELAVKRLSDGGVWKDRKGLSFIDVGARKYWDHVVAIATSSYAIGFDEINFDYVRFPSDGDMKDIHFTHTSTTTKREMLRQFFEYLDRKLSTTDIVTSVDLFGMTTTNNDDLNIGQILENGLMHFDYVAPMVYPSHYPPKFNGWPDPNKVPYDIIKYSMGTAVARANSLHNEIASTTISVLLDSDTRERLLERIKPTQLRPWLQDFDYPVPYTREMVRTQIQATYDVGLTSWMLWDPSNTYTRAALLAQ